MNLALYDQLTPWYHLLDPVADHADEAAVFIEAFERATTSSPLSLLELGSGAGNNGFHLKKRFRCTLSDASPAMLELSRAQNPECTHVHGDMRALRLGRQFDVVLVHDAIVYMTTRTELGDAMRSAYAHTRPGGAAIFAPDVLAETFHEYSQLHEGDDGTRSLRALEWTWDPHPDDEKYAVEWAFLLREAGQVRAVHDRHVEGLFSRMTWLSLLAEVGFSAETIRRPIGDGAYDEIFLARRSI